MTEAQSIIERLHLEGHYDAVNLIHQLQSEIRGLQTQLTEAEFRANTLYAERAASTRPEAA